MPSSGEYQLSQSKFLSFAPPCVLLYGVSARSMRPRVYCSCKLTLEHAPGAKPFVCIANLSAFLRNGGLTVLCETKPNEMVLCETVFCEMVLCETVLCETAFYETVFCEMVLCETVFCEMALKFSLIQGNEMIPLQGPTI